MESDFSGSVELVESLASSDYLEAARMTGGYLTVLGFKRQYIFRFWI